MTGWVPGVGYAMSGRTFNMRLAPACLCRDPLWDDRDICARCGFVVLPSRQKAVLAQRKADDDG